MSELSYTYSADMEGSNYVSSKMRLSGGGNTGNGAGSYLKNYN
jgi:hypothetical protein